MRIALLQMNGSTDPARNGETLCAAIAEAKAGGAAMLFTPEMSNMLDRDRKRAASNIRSQDDDPVLRSVQAAAAEHGIWVHIGSLALKGDEAGDKPEQQGSWVNRGFVIDDQGRIRAQYDKIHLFDVDLDTGESWRESSVYCGGNHAVLVDSPPGRLGLSICYDLRFGALFSRLAGAGAELLSVPAAFTVPTGRAHWHVLLRARAIESAAFVIAAAQCGQHEDGRETWGHSLVVDPWGEIVLDMQQHIGLGYADLDLQRVAEIRKRIPVLANRREIVDNRVS